MTGNRKELARQALSAALQLRIKNGKSLADPICVYDFVESLNVEVWFADIPSLEGMYSSSPRPAIILGSDRPAGRRSYTCAHELGHHRFGHGTKVDELCADDRPGAQFDPDEFAAQVFAGFFLMPKLAVCNAFAVRGWKTAEATPEQIYRISNFFGVTYAGLIHHMARGLQLLTERDADRLLAVKLPSIREQFCDAKRQLIFVDEFWKNRPVDLEIGDILHVPSGLAFTGECLVQKDRCAGEVLEAIQPGHGHVFNTRNGWKSSVRVSRHFYVGRSRYRHLEETTNESSTN